MDGSIHSSMKKEVPPSQNSVSSEESGWTTYFDEFLSANNKNSSACSSGYMGSYPSSSSMVSDAASSAKAAWKRSDYIQPSPDSMAKSCTELSLKKRRKRGALEDESLEDTASSPVNSPKVSDLKELDMNERNKEVDKNSFQGKGIIPIVVQSCKQMRDDIPFVGTECAELKKRGLCLVPLSMLLNYLG